MTRFGFVDVLCLAVPKRKPHAPENIPQQQQQHEKLENSPDPSNHIEIRVDLGEHRLDQVLYVLQHVIELQESQIPKIVHHLPRFPIEGVVGRDAEDIDYTLAVEISGVWRAYYL